MSCVSAECRNQRKVKPSRSSMSFGDVRGLASSLVPSSKTSSALRQESLARPASSHPPRAPTKPCEPPPLRRHRPGQPLRWTHPPFSSDPRSLPPDPSRGVGHTTWPNDTPSRAQPQTPQELPVINDETPLGRSPDQAMPRPQLSLNFLATLGVASLVLFGFSGTEASVPLYGFVFSVALGSGSWPSASCWTPWSAAEPLGRWSAWHYTGRCGSRTGRVRLVFWISEKDGFAVHPGRGRN